MIRRKIGAMLMALGVVMAVIMAGAAFGPTSNYVEEAKPVGDSEAAIATGTAVVIAGGALVAGAAGGYVAAKLSDSSADQDELEKADAAETQNEIYKRVATLHQDRNIFSSAMSNYLQDTQSIARMEGKNAYIRALNNGSSEATARVEAKEAVGDYYANKQMQLIAHWNATVASTESVVETAKNTSGLDQTDVFVINRPPNEGYSENMTESWLQGDPGGHGSQAEVVFNTTTVTLTNTTTVTAAQFYGENVQSESGGATPSTDLYLDPSTWDYNSGGNLNPVMKIGVEHSDSSFDYKWLIVNATVQDRWAQIESQDTKVKNEMDTFISNTYSQIQQGEINESELVDPYLAARDYGPENDSTAWNLRTFHSLGYSSPSELDSFGRMNVSDDDAATTYTDVILMSDGLPAGDEFAVGTQYDAANLEGFQGVLDRDSGTMTELEGNFTIKSAKDADGGDMSSVKYRNISYETANETEFKNLMGRLDNLSAELNAYQDGLRGGNGGFFIPDAFGIPGEVMGMGAALGGGYLLMRGRGNRNFGS